MDAGCIDRSTVPGASQILSAANDHLTICSGNNSYAVGTCLLLNIHLTRLRRSLAIAPRDIISLMPASVWLFDNYHLIYHQLKDIRPAIVSRASARLPAIHRSKIRVRLPRIGALAEVMAASCEGGLDEESICRQLELYQSKCVLTAAELWLLHPWLKQAILRRLISKSDTLIDWLDIKSQADRLANDLDEIEALETSELISKLSTRKIYQDNKDETVWKAHMIYRLRRRSYLDESIGEFINAGIVASDKRGSGYEDAGEIISREEQAQSQLEREVSALIMSLKFLSMLDWSNIFCRTSCLEQKLRQDPAGVYAKMNSDSRDHYRKEIAHLANMTGHSECELASKLQEFCEGHQNKNIIDRQTAVSTPLHNGTALLGYLRRDFLASIGLHDRSQSRRTLLAVLYFCTVILLTAAMTTMFLLFFASAYKGLTALIITVAASILPLIGCAAGTVNAVFHKLVKPCPIMSMDYTEDLPDSARTFIVMPVIFNSEQQVRKSVTRLEQHFLANPQNNFYFAILGDLPDSAYQVSATDELILNRLEQDIENLNRRYPTQPKRFYGFIRQRVWNPAEYCWMGWERKRGKLEEFNRWQTVRTRSPQGQFIYLRDLADGHVWGTTAEPVETENGDNSKTLFGIDKAEFIRNEHQIMTNLEITVAPQEPYELRRLLVSNQSRHERTIEITSYLEPVLTSAQADRAHPAFNRLFIETEYVADRSLLISHRRTSGEEAEHYLGHQLMLPDGKASVEFEIDRLGFIGRNNTLARPDAMFTGQVHSCRQGFCPEPALSLRTSIRLAAGASTVVVFMTSYGRNRAEIMRLSHEARQPAFADGVFSRALVHARLKLQYLGISSKDYNQLLDFVSAVYDSSQAVRCSNDLLSELACGQQSLWRFGISGDYPLVVLELRSSLELPILDQYLQLFEVFTQNQVEADFVILCNQPSGYRQELYFQVLAKTDHLKLALQPKGHRSPYVLQTSDMSRQEYVLLLSSACLYTGVRKRSELDKHLPAVLSFMTRPQKTVTRVVTQAKKQRTVEPNEAQPVAGQTDHVNSEQLLAGEKIQQRSDKYGDQRFWNGTGYFGDDGQSYEIRLEPGVHTPAPWSNVIANEKFGLLVTDKGSGFTWSENSQSGKLTPWSNDPVIDPPGEILLVRDDEQDLFTSACRYDSSAQGRYYISHRFGSSVFEHRDLELDQKMTVTVDEKRQLRFWHLRLHNLSKHRRQLTIILYIDLVLGVHEELTQRFLDIGYDEDREILTAVNRYQEQDRQKTAVLFCSDHINGWTSDRNGFLGHNRDVFLPKGLSQGALPESNDGSGCCPCAVLSVSIQLHDNESRELVFGLGSAANLDSARDLAERCRSNRYFHYNLDRVTESWKRRLSLIKITSPDKALDVMFNGWLLYQVISCRMRARAAFYQCGGAYGFRDQLQDSLALLIHDHQYVRNHLLRCASRQFREGDVQHWWHDDTNVGVRTRISDDLLWLPYVLCRYVDVTGDLSILDEQVAWLIGDKLEPDEHDRAFVAEITKDTASMFEHALAAVGHAATRGPHGLPLFGGGDWNDGIDLAGAAGQGESVWLGWFVITVLDMFSSLCSRIGRNDLVADLRSRADAYVEAVETAAWDNKWYLRGWFDNGQPMGSRRNIECRIDSISQSWAVISGRAGKDRIRQALESADHYLVKDAERTVLLLTPPFDGLGPEPGYIRRYYTGVRENGGQYTHAAAWLALACLRAGRHAQGAHLISLLNPITHALGPADVNKFRTEPYVLSADVYDGDPYSGRGGWSWYTGSASWYYQVILHDLLGINREAGEIVIKPRLPDSLLPMTITYKYHESTYVINMRHSGGQHPSAHGIWLDQIKVEGSRIKLEPGPGRHSLLVYIE